MLFGNIAIDGQRKNLPTLAPWPQESVFSAPVLEAERVFCCTGNATHGNWKYHAILQPSLNVTTAQGETACGAVLRMVLREA
jgi:hypothetical protein